MTAEISMFLRDCPQGTVLDIGANHGMYTGLFADHFPKVFAFEPSPANLLELQKNVGNRLNVEIIPKALSNMSGTTALWTHMNPGMHTIEPTVGSMERKWGHDFEPLSVERTTLDQFVADRDITDLVGMKIDVEGHEQFLLEGAYHTLRRFPLWITMETHGNIDCDAVFQLLTSAGYYFFTSAAAPLHCIQRDYGYVCHKA